MDARLEKIVDDAGIYGSIVQGVIRETLKVAAEIADSPEWKKLSEKGGIANITVAGKAIAQAILKAGE